MGSSMPEEQQRDQQALLDHPEHQLVVLGRQRQGVRKLAQADGEGGQYHEAQECARWVETEPERDGDGHDDHGLAEDGHDLALRPADQ